MQQPQDLYELLQISPSAELDVVQAAYRRLATRYGPNRDASPEAASIVMQLNHAYEILSDPDRRAEYDRSRSADTAHWQGTAGTTPWRGIRESHLVRMVQPLLLGAVGSVFGFLLLSVSLVVAAGFVSFIWWLSDLLYGIGWWPLGFVARLAAWLIVITIVLRLLILASRAVFALSKWAWRYSDYVVRPRVPMTAGAVIVVVVLATVVGIGIFYDSRADALSNRNGFIAPTPSNPVKQTPAANLQNTMPVPKSLTTMVPQVGRPSISVNKLSATPGTMVSMDATGFKPFAQVTSLEFGGVDVTPSPRPSIDAEGNANFVFLVPAIFGVQKVELDVGGINASLGFRVTRPDSASFVTDDTWSKYSEFGIGDGSIDFSVSFEIPPGWHVSRIYWNFDNFEEVNLTIESPEPQHAVFSLFFSPKRSNLTLDQRADKYLGERREFAEKFELQGRSATSLTGRPAVRIDYNEKSEFGCFDREKVWFFVARDTSVRLLVTHCEGAGPDYQADLDLVLNSLTVG